MKTHSCMQQSFAALAALSTALLIGCGLPTGGSVDESFDIEPLQLEPGDLWQRSTKEPSAPGIYASAFQFSQMSWAPFAAGKAKVLTVEAGRGETLSIHATPLAASGNLDIFLYDKDPTLPWSPVASVAQSTRAAGYVDQIYFTTATSAASRVYYVKLSCTSGTCAFTTQIGKGDATAFTAGGTYLNQRSFPGPGKAASGNCRLNGVIKADGECMCAPVSAAMGVVMAGKVPHTELRNTAVALFSTNVPNDGAANRYALMQRLKSSYSYASCQEYTNASTLLSTLKQSLRSGSMVLFRSPRFSASGHYVQVRGYSSVNSRDTLLVNDPYGAWSSFTTWNPPNSTDASSANGDSRFYEYLRLADPGASLIVCN